MNNKSGKGETIFKLFCPFLGDIRGEPPGEGHFVRQEAWSQVRSRRWRQGGPVWGGGERARHDALHLRGLLAGAVRGDIRLHSPAPGLCWSQVLYDASQCSGP